jgi:hypothetical protein
METHQVNRLAVGDSAKALREALRSLGKRCSLRWIYYQCQPSQDVRRLDVYGAFWRFFQALWRANRTGAELLFEDFRARVQALRHSTADLCRADWYESLAELEQEHSEALQAAIRNHDLAAIKKEIGEAIAAYRRLLAIVEVRGKCLDAGRAALSPPAAARPTTN